MFADATAVAPAGTTSGSTGGYTLQPGEPHPCGHIGATAWFTIVPGTSGKLTASTAGSGFDTVLALYSGTAINSLHKIQCNDDVNGTLQSAVSGNVTAGQTYYVQLGGYRGATGSYALDITLQ